MCQQSKHLRMSCSRTAAVAVLDEMHDTLEQMGIAVVQLHAEAGPGQFEIVTGHSPAMQVRSGRWHTLYTSCHLIWHHVRATLIQQGWSRCAECRMRSSSCVLN